MSFTDSRPEASHPKFEAQYRPRVIDRIIGKYGVFLAFFHAVGRAPIW